MIRTVIDSLIMLPQIIVFTYFMAKLLKVADTKKFMWTMCCFLHSFYIGFSFMGIPIGIRSAILFLLLIFSLYWYQKDNPVKVLCLVLFIVIFQLIAESAASFIIMFTLHKNKYEIMNNFPLLMFARVLVLPFLAMALFLLNFLWDIFIDKSDLKQSSLILLFPASQLICLMIISLYEYASSVQYGINLLSIATAVCIIADIGAFYTIRQSQEKYILEEKQRVMTGQLNMQLAHYGTLKGQLEKAKLFYHDTNNMLQTIQTLIQQDNYPSAQALLNTFCVQIQEANPVCFCANNFINAILLHKAEVCKKNKIDYQFDIQVPAGVPIDLGDLCSVFNNILDNAITACLQKGNTSRYIHLKVRTKAAILLINCENSKTNPIRKISKHKFLTTKDNPEEHGLGITILQYIAKKYDGSCDIQYSERKFCITIALNLGWNGM